MTLGPGDVLGGRYRVESLLASGGFGCVSRVTHLGTGGQFALKVLRPEICERAEDRARLAREASVLKGLDHPRLVKLIDFELGEGQPYLVFSLVEGPELKDVMKAGALPVRRALDLARQIAEGVGVMHERGLVHRDLKPENVKVSGADEVTILDLGLAKHVGGARRTVEAVTQAGDVVGSPLYLPPEIITDSEPTPAADVWAIGVMLYQMLTGSHPVPREYQHNALGFIQWWKEPRIEPARRLRPDLSPQVAALVDRLLAVEPGNRVQTGTDAVREIEGAAEGLVTREYRKPGEGAVEAPVVDGQRAKARPGRAQGGVRSSQGSGQAASAAPVELPAKQRGLGLVALAALVAVLGLGIVARGLRAVPARVESPAPAASPSTAMTEPVEDEAARLARQLRELLGKHRGDLGEAWLKRFAQDNRSDVRKAAKDPAIAAKLAAKIRGHLETIGLLGPLEAFLKISGQYFASLGDAVDERWALRSTLCDVELIEYFCEEHRIPWPVQVKVGGGAGGFQVRAEPNLLNLLSAKSWISCESVEEHQFASRGTMTDRWRLPSHHNRRCLVWFCLLTWRSGLILDVSFGPRFRQLLRFYPRPQDPGPFAVQVEEAIGDGCASRGSVISVLKNASWAGRRAYVGAWVPAGLFASETNVSSRVVDLPLSAAGAQEANLRARVISILGQE